MWVWLLVLVRERRFAPRLLGRVLGAGLRPSVMAALLNGGCSCRSGALHRGFVLWNLGVWIVTT